MNSTATEPMALTDMDEGQWIEVHPTLAFMEFKHRCSTDNAQFYCFRESAIRDHDFYHIYIKKGETGKVISTFEEMTDSVFSIFHKEYASSALNIIKAYAVHEHIYNYYETDALRRYESDDFIVVRSSYSPVESSSFVFEYNLCQSLDNVDEVQYSTLTEPLPCIEKWQTYAYKQSCEYSIGSIYSNEDLNVELLQCRVGPKSAYALAFMSSKTTLFELNNSQRFISVYNKKTGTAKQIENLTYLAILMEIIDTPLIATDEEKYSLIQKIKRIRKAIGVQ